MIEEDKVESIKNNSDISISLNYENEQPDFKEISGGGWESEESNNPRENNNTQEGEFKDFLQIPGIPHGSQESGSNISHSNILDKAIVMEDSKIVESVNTPQNIGNMNFGFELEEEEGREAALQKKTANFGVNKDIDVTPPNIKVQEDLQVMGEGNEDVQNAHGEVAASATLDKGDDAFHGTGTQMPLTKSIHRTHRNLYCCMLEKSSSNGDKLIGIKCAGCRII